MLDPNCGICGLVAEPTLLQACFRCDVTFHLNPYANVEGIDCGDAVIGLELGVYFYCTPCLGAMNDEANAFAAQQARELAIERRPGWTATPPLAVPPRRPAAAPRRRRFRRIDAPMDARTDG